MDDRNDHALDALLKEYPMPMAEPAYFERAIANASRTARQRERKKGWLAGFGTAAAVGLVFWVATLWILPSDDAAVPELPGVVMTLETPKTVNLMFASADALNDARVILTLPAGIELDGFPGERSIEWMTSLDAGNNLLPLPLVARSGDGGELVATLSHGDRSKTFRIQINLQTSRS